MNNSEILSQMQSLLDQMVENEYSVLTHPDEVAKALGVVIREAAEYHRRHNPGTEAWSEQFARKLTVVRHWYNSLPNKDGNV